MDRVRSVIIYCQLLILLWESLPLPSLYCGDPHQFTCLLFAPFFSFGFSPFRYCLQLSESGYKDKAGTGSGESAALISATPVSWHSDPDRSGRGGGASQLLWSFREKEALRCPPMSFEGSAVCAVFGSTDLAATPLWI